MDIRRFGGQHWRSREWTLARTTEVYSTYYDIHYPNEERQAGRPLRTSPTYERLTALGAVFGEKSGWERPNWFEPNADDPRWGGRAALEACRPRGWAGQHWSPAIAAEALATRNAVAIFDETSFAKIEVIGQRRGGVPRAAVRERGRRPGRARRLHLDAELARRDRDRPDRDPGRAGPLPARHRDRVRPARPGLAPEAPAGRRQRAAQRHHVRAASASGCGARPPATSSRRSRPTTSRTRRSRS